MNKHNEWRITSQYIGGEKMYAVYRLIDAEGTDHSGNREYACAYMESKAKAMEIADRLNAGKEE